ncbi:lipid-binding protein [Pontibacter sp. MBLB2868]|uniref:lipid-binding protein n=1 Tax=Pontibacter sp. MBLB2868 TaxID=3451555 RepID=UPI003F754FAA
MSACEKDAPEVKYTATYPVSGEWWVTYKVETDPGVFEDVEKAGYTPLLTYNTAANKSDAIWVDDQGNFRDFKIKSGLDVASRSFSVKDAINTASDNNVSITEGKVIKDGGVSKTKIKTDSIYFKAEFSDEPGTIYHVSGHRRTGFPEDQY